MKKAIEAVVQEDECAKIKSKQAQDAIACATSTISFLERNDKGKFEEFAETVVAKLKCCFKSSGGTLTEESKPLTFEEHNALRYVAGYVLRSVRNNIKEVYIARQGWPSYYSA